MIKNEIKNLISQFYDELVEGNTENFLRIVTTSEVFKDNNSALLQLKAELQLDGIYNTGIEALIKPDKRGLIPEPLKDFQIESSDDVLAKFRTNHQAVAQINQFFNKKLAYLKSKLPKGQYNSKQSQRLYKKRNN